MRTTSLAPASEEVEQILTAAVRVMARSAPEPPKVSDIVAEAGSCNKAFYRYFGVRTISCWP